MRPIRVLVPILIVLSLVLAAQPGQGETAGHETLCPGFQDVPGQGPSCPVPGGWRVFLRDGTSVLTHGGDPPPSAESGIGLLGAGGPPVCATNPAVEYHGHVIYARATDRTDRYTTMASTIREMVNKSNSLLRLEASTYGAHISYRMHCDAAGFVTVSNAELPTLSASASFSTIASDLRAQGYTSDRAKYWVWYDGSVSPGVAGQGTIRIDDRLTVNNANNRGGDFGMTYGYTGDFGAQVMMHENGHNLGAVQLSAPHSSGGFHCNDGLDVMCYSDGGSNASYTTSRCTSRLHWDCGGDSYFNPNPPAGSYLASHWNLGSTLNRFFHFGDVGPTMRSLSCFPNPVDAEVNTTCSLFGEDDGGLVHFEIDWGDGTSQRHPATGTVEAGRAHGVRHSWENEGDYTVQVRVFDTQDPPQMDERSVTVRVTCTYVRTSQLLVGLLGVEHPGWSVKEHDDVPAACWGKPFLLRGTSQVSALLGPETGDFNLCWLDEQGETLACHNEVGDEHGLVPEGAAGVRVVFYSGVVGFYRVQVG